MVVERTRSVTWSTLGLSRGAVQVHATEHDAVVHGRGFKVICTGVSGVQGVALDGDLAQRVRCFMGVSRSVETTWK